MKPKPKITFSVRLMSVVTQKVFRIRSVSLTIPVNSLPMILSNRMSAMQIESRY